MPDELDRLIDAGLCEYTTVFPTEGFTARVLHHAKAPSRWWTAMLVPAAAIAAAMAWVAYLPTPPGPAYQRVAVIAPPLPIPTSVQSKPVQAKRRPVEPARPPLFAPLSAGELALIAFVQRDPEQARQAFDSLRDRTTKPIEIDPIDIPLLQKETYP